MKQLKFFAIFSLCLVFITHVNAQSKAGIRAGVLISKQAYDGGMLNVDTKSKLGADLALVCDFPIGEIFAISPEFHWLQKGAKIKDLNAPFSESSRTFNYLEIPVLFKIRFGSETGFFLFAGPSIGYLFDQTDKDGDGSNNDVDIHDFKRAELGAHLGGGVAFGPLRVDIRYIAGFSDIADFESDNVKIKNSGYGAGVTLMF